MAGHLNISFQ